jgi:hypothetical protein
MTTIREYALKVAQVRNLQKRYLVAARTSQVGKEQILKLSKEAETELDKITSQILSEETVQQEIF